MPKAQNKGLAQAKAVRATNMVRSGSRVKKTTKKKKKY